MLRDRPKHRTDTGGYAAVITNEEASTVITCVIRYEIEPFKLAA